MIPRSLEQNIQKWLFKEKIIILTGARQVGKTTLLKKIIDKLNTESLFLNGDDSITKKLFEAPSVTNFRNLIGNSRLLFIDEAQRIENIGICLKLIYDNFSNVQTLVSGSSALEIADKIFEPLTGRHFLYHLYPFTMNELYSNNFLKFTENLNWHLVYGCYPDVVNHQFDAKKYLKSIANSYLYKDVLSWKDIRKPELLDKLLQLIALQLGSEVSVNELANQLKVKSETVESYLDLLEKSFVIFRLKSYATNERKEVTKMKKIYFWDVGIRNAIIDNFKPIEARTDIGALFENFVIADRIKTNQYNENDIKPYFWRSLQKQEVDYVEYFENKLSGFEIKWNLKNKITKSFQNLYPDSTANIIHPNNLYNFLIHNEF